MAVKHRFPGLRRYCAGFTLVEVLVATTMLVIILGVVFTLAVTALRHWEQHVDRLAMEREVDVIFSLLARDLQSLLRDPSRDVLVAISDPLDADAYATLRIYARISSPGSPGGGDVQALFYGMEESMPGHGPALHRISVDPETVWREWRVSSDSLAQSPEAFREASGDPPVVTLLSLRVERISVRFPGDPLILDGEGLLRIPGDVAPRNPFPREVELHLWMRRMGSGDGESPGVPFSRRVILP